MLKCQPGFVKVGAGRTRCRFTEARGFHWGKPLGQCQGCPAEDPTSNDRDLSVACKLTKSKKRQCLLQCPVWYTMLVDTKVSYNFTSVFDVKPSPKPRTSPNCVKVNSLIDGSGGRPLRKFKIVCKCPRNKGAGIIRN